MCAPSPPDPVATAGAQTGMNIGTAVANSYLGNVNQVTPNGNLTYTQSGMQSWTDPVSGQVHQIPQFTATQTLSEGGQRINDLNMGTQETLAGAGNEAATRIRSLLGQGMDTSGLPPQAQAGNLQTGIMGAGGIQRGIEGAGGIGRVGAGPELQTSYNGDFSRDRGRVERALMGRMQGGLDRDRGALEDRLASQGIAVGSEAYQAAMSDLGRQTNDARMSAIISGGQEQSRMVGLERDRAIFGNNAEQTMYGNRTNSVAQNNAAQAQQFGQNAQQAAFRNNAQAQQFGQNAQQAAFGNTAMGQQFDMDTRARSGALQEMTQLRNQPLNEIMALLGGTQVQQPQFQNIQGPQAATTDYAGIVNNNYQQQMQQYGANGGLFSGALRGIMGGFGL